MKAGHNHPYGIQGIARSSRNISIQLIGHPGNNENRRIGGALIETSYCDRELCMACPPADRVSNGRVLIAGCPIAGRRTSCKSESIPAACLHHGSDDIDDGCSDVYCGSHPGSDG
jgi:hypothetical protein